MAATAVASKRTSEGQALGAKGLDRSRQSLPLAHGRTGAGEAGWPDAPVPQFPTEGPFFELDGTVVLEGLSAAATRGRRKPRAGSTWSRAPGFLGIPAPGGPRPARRRGAVEGGSPSRDTPPAEGGDDLFTTPGPDQQSCRPPKDPCICCKDCGASDSAGEDNPAMDRPWNGCPRPVFVHYQSRDPFGPKTTRPGRSWELESGRWPVKLAPALCPWEPGNPEPSGNPSHEEIDPFQVVDELTARDIQWQTTIRVTLLGLEDLQQFLRLSLEGFGSFSQVGRSVPSRGLASQTRV